MYRSKKEEPELFLVHPGGPLWKNKDNGAWSIPKGEFTNEEPLTAAIREFGEETGSSVNGNFIALTPVRSKSGKLIMAWGVEGNIDPDSLRSNTFSLEWPPKSGKIQLVPEVDKGAWFLPNEAKIKINPAQIPLINELLMIITDEKMVE